MDLSLLFDSAADSFSKVGFENDTLFKSVVFNTGKVPKLKAIDLAIVGISSENRVNADNIRRQLYNLKRSNCTYKIIDLGNLRQGIDEVETKLRLTQVLSYLHDKEVVALIIGAGHDFDYAQYQSYELLDKLVSILNVDARLDIADKNDAPEEDSHIHKILLHEPNYLFNYIHVGYQSYLVPYQGIEALEKLSFTSMRLGQLRDKPEELEPLVREADMMSFDLGAIQKQYINASSRPTVFGLTGEEACQLCWYAGNTEKMSSAGFYGYTADLDDENLNSAFVVATMIWYFIEGYYNRKDKYEFSTRYYTKYRVAVGKGNPSEIIFYKSKKSEKWWMEIPAQNHSVVYTRNFVVPCSYQDYLQAGKGELPARWINAVSKLV